MTSHENKEQIGEFAYINFITITIFLNQQNEGFYGLGAYARSTNKTRETAKRHYNTGSYNQGNLVLELQRFA